MVNNIVSTFYGSKIETFSGKFKKKVQANKIDRYHRFEHAYFQ